jgi:hypothetical protein
MPIPNKLRSVLVAIKPQETVLFSTAARNPEFKDFIEKEIEGVEMTPAGKRIFTLITGGHSAQATVAERKMAWQFAQMSPEGKRLMKADSSIPPSTPKRRQKPKA